MRFLPLLFVATFHLCVVSRLCSAESPSNAVVRISSTEVSGCGTGFFTDQGAVVATNVHVADLLCRGGFCHGIVLERGITGGGYQKFTPQPLELRVALRLPSIDAAFLALPSDVRSESSLELTTSAPQAGEEVRMIGFPSCSALQEATGIVSGLDLVAFSSGAIGASGSSGSPILGSDGKVVGIAFQADSLARAIYDKFHGGSFVLRAVRADVASMLRSSVTAGSRLAEYDLLLRFYTEQIGHADGLNRVSHALYFLNAVRTLAEVSADESSNPEVLRSAALLDHFPGALLQVSAPAPITPDGIAFERLVFAANLESRGAFVSFTEPLTADLLTRSLHDQNRPEDQIQSLVALLPKGGAGMTPGLAPLGAITGVAFAVLGVFLLLAWGWSLGYVYASAAGGRFRRLFMMVCVAVLLWPASLVIFRIFGKKAR